MVKQTRTVNLIGTGMGTKQSMTAEAAEVLWSADIIFGAERMLQLVPQEAPFICEYRAEKIRAYLAEHDRYQNAAVLLSGDTGFFSGAKKIIEALEPQFQVKVYCGISSVAYFAAKLGIAWEDMALASRHGRTYNLVGLLARREKVFSLFSNAEEIRELAAELLEFGMKDVKMAVGNNLGTKEYISGFATPDHYLNYERSGLHVAVLCNTDAKEFVSVPGIADEEFYRDKVPMTKEEVRVIAISKLRLKKDSILYDIGAGTGSVSVEAARIAYEGLAVAFEKNPLAAGLIKKNRLKFQTPNIMIAEGDALEILKEGGLPVPTHAFLGGTGGKLEAVLDCLFEINPRIQTVVNTVTIESLSRVLEYCTKRGRKAEYVQVAVSVSRQAGEYHLMQAHNPVMIIRL